MPEHGLAVYVHFANLGATLTVLGVVLREYKVYGRIKERMNELWFNYCGERQKLYSPVEIGALYELKEPVHKRSRLRSLIQQQRRLRTRRL